MSADNWAVCENCLRIAREKLKESYGKVSQEEYQELEKELEELESGEKKTYSEYYEQGMTNNFKSYFCSYGGSCDVCGFEHSFRHEEKTSLGDEK